MALDSSALENPSARRIEHILNLVAEMHQPWFSSANHLRANSLFTNGLLMAVDMHLTFA
jgi:hypothetical protein